MRPIEHRLAELTRLPALALWTVLTAFALVLCIAWHNATGAWRGLEVGGEPFWQTPWGLEIVFAAIFGYVVTCGNWIARSIRADLEALSRTLGIEPSELAAERDSIGLFAPSALLAAGAAGFALGVAINAAVNAVLPEGHSALDDRLWRFVRDVTIWTLAARLVLVVIGSSQRVSELSRAAPVDLLDLRGLAPLARIGLRNALAFAVAASMIGAMSGDVPVLPVTLVSMAIVGAGGTLALLLPVRGARRAIRAAKDAELRSVREAIARARSAALAGGAAGADEATRLGGLLAYEARIAGVVEWPLDVGTYVRFALFLALPLGSWIAGALVERAVSIVLG